MKRTLLAIAAAASFLPLAACGGQGDDTLGEQAQEAMENRAETMEAQADNLSGAAEDAMDARADATREAGETKEEAIDRSDVNADALTDKERADIVNPR